jgi:DNA-binding CsgD family transcriptional regulator
VNAITELPRFIGFLNLLPNTDDFAQKLHLDFLRPAGANFVGIFLLTKTGGLKPICEHGATSHQFNELNLLESLFETKNLFSELSTKKVIFSPDLKKICTGISNGKSEVGIVAIEVIKPIDGETKLTVEALMGLTSFYLYSKIQPTLDQNTGFGLSINPLSPRQKQIVQGIVEGKTNHELSLDLGFSVSTIRHETMAIFKSLGASDRKEAAKIALNQSLI